MLRLATNPFEIRWTCVPSDVVKGASGDELRLKIVVAPRAPLDAETVIVFEDLFSRWPEVVRNDLTSFDVSFATAGGVVAKLKGKVIHDGIVKDKKVWPKGFPSLATRPENSKNPEPLFVDQGFGSSYNAVTAERQIQARRIVQVVADLLTPRSPEEYLLKWQLEQILAMATATLSLQGPEAYEPSVQPPAVAGLYGPAEPNLSPRQEKLLARNKFRAVADGNTKPDATLLLNSAARAGEQTHRINFLAADAVNDCVVFNTRVKPLQETSQPPSLKQKEPDFAERLGLVRQYPELAELLALTLDVRLLLDDVKKAAGEALQDPSLRVWATPAWKHADVSIARAPATLCKIDVDKKHFAASERMSDGVEEDKEHLNGHLRLNNGKWKLTTLDIDGASIKNGTYAVSRREIAPAFVTDVNGKMLQANFSAYALFGRAKGSLAGKGMWTCVHDESLRPMLKGLRVAGIPLRAANQQVALLGSGTF